MFPWSYIITFQELFQDIFKRKVVEQGRNIKTLIFQKPLKFIPFQIMSMLFCMSTMIIA